MSEPLQISYIDEGFSVSRADNCRLSLQLMGDEYTMAVFCPQQRLRLLLQWKGEERDSRVDHLLGLTYISRMISIEQQSCTLLPEDLFDVENKNDLYPILGLLPESHQLHVDFIPQENIVTVSGLKNHFADFIIRQFPTCKTISSATSFLSAVLASCINDLSTLYVNFRNSQTDFAYIQQGQLLFFSQFPNSDPDEFNYFLLSCAKHLNMVLTDTSICLSGQISLGDPYHERCTKYGQQVYFATVDAFFDEPLPKTLAEPHRFFSLFGLTLCE